MSNNTAQRQILLDTETTGLEPSAGHRIIEIGCVEMIDRKVTGRNFHYYLQPDRVIDKGAIEVHGITNDFLNDKPRFNSVATELIDFIRDADVIIHNAPFDVGFLNSELQRLSNQSSPFDSYCNIVDTLVIARNKFPGQRNTLDALCKRFSISNEHRTLHGALLDSEILADVYLALTGGQIGLNFLTPSRKIRQKKTKVFSGERPPLRVIKASEEEVDEHQRMLKELKKQSGVAPIWLE